MTRTRFTFLPYLLFFLLLLCAPSILHAQTSTGSSDVAVSPQAEQLIKSSPLTAKEKEDMLGALRKGLISSDQIIQLQQRGQLGTLTPAEIAKGKAMLEKKEKLAEKEEKKEVKALVEKAEALPYTSPEQIAEKLMEKEEELKAEEEYFKKTFGPEREPLKIFGHELFTGAPSTFAPIEAVPVSNTYIIGPGDEINVFMWGRIDATYGLRVDNEGLINFPEIGPLSAAGLTFGELKRLIKRKAEAITGVNVSVSMGKLRTIQVFVLGEVKGPGLYTVSSLATVANALLSSGGPTQLGSLRKVQLKRRGVGSLPSIFTISCSGATPPRMPGSCPGTWCSCPRPAPWSRSTET